MRSIIHVILMLAMLLQPLPAMRACGTITTCAPATPADETCCCCSATQDDAPTACGCGEPAKPAPMAPAHELRPDIDLFPALLPTLIDPAPAPIDRSSPATMTHAALRGGSPSMQSLLCVWRT